MKRPLLSVLSISQKIALVFGFIAGISVAVLVTLFVLYRRDARV